MKKLFFRAFISIISIVLVIIFIVALSILLFYRNATDNWVQSSFHAFCNQVALEISKSSEPPTLENFIMIADKTALADNRISGLLFRDVNEKVVFSVGSSIKGSPLAQRNTDKKEQYQDTSLEQGRYIDPALFKTVKIHAPLNFLEINSDEVRLNVYDNLHFASRLVEIPPSVDEKSISGSLVVLVDGNYIFSTDVLIYTPSTYKLNRSFMTQLRNGIVISIVIAIILALFLSYLYSKHNKNYVDSIRNALEDLSKGRENVALPKSTIEEHNQITESIKALDNVLALNRKGRKAWLNNITHDLYTPVTSMQILLDGLEDGIFPMSIDVIKQIKMEHTDLLNRIQRVVTYSSLQSPDKKIMIGKVMVKNFIIELLNSCKDFDKVNYIEKTDEIYCDLDTMKLAVSELLKNALEASDEVDLYIYSNKIIVENKGTLKENVSFFEPWERGDKSRTSGGNGLGLPIVAQIVRLHKGRASIEQVDDLVRVSLSWHIPI